MAWIALLVLCGTTASGSGSGRAAEPIRLKVLTFNTWLLNFALQPEVAEDIEERLAVMPTHIWEQTGADIILLQEVWASKARDALISGFRELGYPYAIYQPKSSSPQALLGNGLLMISRLPLDPEFHTLKFSVYTRPDEVFAKKGAIHARVELPGGIRADLYTSHLGAISFDEKKLEFNADHEKKNLQQATELTRFVASTADPMGVRILGADLNRHFTRWIEGEWSSIASSIYEIFSLEWLDVFLVSQGRFPRLEEFSFNRENPYVSDGIFSKAPSETEDYLFVSKSPQLVPLKAEIVFQEPLPDGYRERFGLKNLPKRLSDHYGVLGTFEVRPSP